MTIKKQPRIELKRPFFSKGEYVYQLLRDKIANGYLERNKIYAIVEIAEGLGICRTAVGEAVKILASQKYIALYKEVGFKVKELNSHDIRENLTISGALEMAVLRKIIKDGTNTIEKLREAVATSWKAIENQISELYTQSSAEFHKAFYALAVLPRVTEILYANVFVNDMWHREGITCSAEGIKRLIVEHENIIKVIRHRHYGQIDEVINTHIEDCEEVLLQFMQA